MFKSLRTKQISVIYVFFTAILLWIKPIFFDTDHAFLFQSDHMPVFAWIKTLLAGNLYLERSIALLLLFLQALLLMQINRKHIFLADRGYMPAFIFVLICSAIPMNQNLLPILFSNFFLLFAIDRLFASYRRERSINGFFDIGILLGLGSLFYAYLLLFIPFFYIAMAVIRPFFWREWLNMLLGLSLPYIYLYSYHFVKFDDYTYLYELYLQKTGSALVNLGWGQAFFIYIGILSFYVLLASQNIFPYLTRKKVSVRKFFTVIFWLFVSTIAIYFVYPLIGFEILYTLAIPLAYLISNYFMNIRRRFISSLFFGLFVLGTLYIQFQEEVWKLVDLVM